MSSPDIDQSHQTEKCSFKPYQNNLTDENEGVHTNWQTDCDRKSVTYVQFL